jgi:hypothetical protein
MISINPLIKLILYLHPRSSLIDIIKINIVQIIFHSKQPNNFLKKSMIIHDWIS